MASQSSLRARIRHDLTEATRARDALRLSTLRLISAALKDQDIAARTTGQTDGVDDTQIMSILTKMVRQRRESAQSYMEAGRLEQAGREEAEIEVIEAYLPRPLSEDEVRAAVRRAVEETGASGIRDMGRVMGALKERYAGQMDFARAGSEVKALLG